MLMILFPIFLLNFNRGVLSFKYTLISLGIALLGYLPLMFFFKAINRGKIGVITPISNSSIVVTVLFSVLFFGEKLSFMRMVSIAIISFGIILISVDFKDIKKNHLSNKENGIFFALISMFLWGVVSALYKIPVMVIGPIMTTFIVEAGILLSSGIAMIREKRSFFLKDGKTAFQTALVALFGAIGVLSYNFGLGVSNINFAASLTSCSPLVATLYGKYFCQEEIKKNQWFAIFILMGGIILLSSFA